MIRSAAAAVLFGALYLSLSLSLSHSPSLPPSLGKLTMKQTIYSCETLKSGFADAESPPLTGCLLLMLMGSKPLPRRLRRRLEFCGHSMEKKIPKVLLETTKCLLTKNREHRFTMFLGSRLIWRPRKKCSVHAAARANLRSAEEYCHSGNITLEHNNFSTHSIRNSTGCDRQQTGPFCMHSRQYVPLAMSERTRLMSLAHYARG